MPPQVNAQLRTVAARGSTDPFEETPPSSTAVFEGSEPAWYEERRRRVSGLNASGAAMSDVLVERSLTVDPIAVDWKVGLTVTFDRDGFTDPVTGTIQAVEAPFHPDVPDEINTVRLTLEVA